LGYSASGTITSTSIDTTTSSPTYDTIDWNATTSVNTSVKFQLAYSADNSTFSSFLGPDGTAGTYFITSGTNIPTVFNGKRYIKYQATLATTNATETPNLNDLTFNYHFNYPTTAQTLTSSIYNTETSAASLSSLQWSQTLPANTDIQFQLRTSSDGTTWGPWCGPDNGTAGTCNSSTYFSDNSGGDSIDDIQNDKSNDQYFQYKAFLSSSDGINTPTLSDVSTSYADLSAPTVTTVATSDINPTAAQGNGNITATNGENPTRYIEWGTSTGTYTDSCSAGTGGTGAYSCNITNLTPDTTYYYRAKATNSAGTSYGSELSFHTLPNFVTIIDPDTTDMTNAVSNNYVTLDSGSITSTPSVTTNTGIIFQDGIVQLTVPQSTQITKSDTGDFNFQSFVTESASTTVKQTVLNSLAAVKIGVPNTKLSFSNNITLSIDINPAYNGRTLDVLYQEDGESIWHSQTSCIITDGKCSFTTNHATTYTVNGSGNMVGETGINLNTDIQEIISLDCGGTTVNLGNITPGTPVTGNSTCTATTNANGGYTLSVKRDDASGTTMDKDTEPTTEIPDKTAWNPTAPNAITWTGTGLGFTVYDSSATKNTTWWGTGLTINDSNNLYAGFPDTQQNIMVHTSYSDISTATDIGYKLDVPPTQKSGAYSGAITYEVVTTP
jgi:hypothetical protein